MSILPDEILSEILSPALKVSDDVFSDISQVSPFADYSPSTSAYLVVCKDWLRVATPLLYNVVVLRSKAQANALEKVLRSNPQFGRFIKKLRVEGGYGMTMHAILKSAPNTTDIVLSLSIWSSDNTQGLCQGLPLIDPNRVIVMAPVLDKPLKNKHLAALMAALFSCIRTWEKLRIFGFPYSDKDLHPISTERAFKLAEALAQSQTIHTVLLPFMDMYRIPEFFTPLRKIPSLQILQLRGPRNQDAEVVINSDRHLEALVRYPTQDFEDKTSSLALAVPDITPTLNPSFSPLKSASDETRDTLWRHVLFFAMYVEELQCPTFPRSPTVSHPSRLPILLVSKYFNRLALPYIYDCVGVTDGGAPSIARQLQHHPELGSFIRYIFILGDRIPEDAMLTILSSGPNVQKIRKGGSEFRTHARISAKGFEVAAQTAGSSLREFSILFKYCSPISTSAFAHLTELRVLLLDFYDITWLTPDPTSPIVLERLHTLSIASSNGSFFDALSMMRLEALHTLRLPSHIPIPDLTNIIKLLDTHGGRLLRLTLRYENMQRFRLYDICTSLVEIEFFGLCDIADLTCKTPHTSLIKIIAWDLLGKPEEINSDMFPALRAIQLRWHRWPTNERDISKSEVVPWAETLSQKNITLTDANGKQWVPRVKSSAVRRRR
ncbi:hypothetical protein DFH09DRAFT_1042324 [Mycena vulgaris]|nr:hypothetical protein DFH09DRAFT_1042324 [Mycena vulgaris]